MTKTNIFKKTTTVFLAFLMLFCSFCTFGNVTVGAVTERVSLYSANTYSIAYGYVTREIYVQTNDNAYDQQVYIHYQGENSWIDEQATYFTTLPDGSKIWRAYVGSRGLKYAIKYVADGETYWDNNNGNDYTFEDIGSAPISAKRSEYLTVGNFTANVVLQNYAYEKIVKIRYTEDNWATFQDVALSYQSTNTDGTEVWSTNLTLTGSDTSEFEYCYYYQVNGQTYWANNFGQNYNAGYYIHR